MSKKILVPYSASRETHKDEFEYLDDLRESSVTNMMFAGSYLSEEFGWSANAAHVILTAWKKDPR